MKIRGRDRGLDDGEAGNERQALLCVDERGVVYGDLGR